MRASYTRKRITSRRAREEISESAGIISVRALKILLAAAALGLLLVGLSVVLPSLREQNFLRYFDDSRKIQNDLFTIYHEKDDPAGAAVEGILRKFLVHLYEAWGGPDRLDLRSPRELESPVLVLLFKDEERLRKYHGPRYLDQIIEFNAGMYESIAGTISLYSDTRRGFPELQRGLYHETTHMVLDRLVRGRDPAWSLWLNEGLATYLESSRTLTGVGFKLGDTKQHYLVTALASKSTSLRDVLAFTHKDFTGADNTRAYALSSLLVAFLLEGEGRKYQELFWKYFAAERISGPVKSGTLEHLLGEDLETLTPAFQAFVRARLGLGEERNRDG